MGYANRVLAVTGAGKGAGEGVARALAEEGYAVSLGDINAESAEAVAADIREKGGRAFGHGLDVTDAASAQEWVDATVSALGGLDVLVNNAGVISYAPLEKLEESEWDRVVDVCLKGVFLCTKAALPHIPTDGGGRIISIASQAGKRGDPWQSHYSSSKFGVIGFTQSVAMEVADKKITVNAICPTIMKTDMMRQIAEETAAIMGIDADERYNWYKDIVPVGRATLPADVAGMISYLASDKAEFVTGQALNLTGGLYMS